MLCNLRAREGPAGRCRCRAGMLDVGSASTSTSCYAAAGHGPSGSGCRHTGSVSVGWVDVEVGRRGAAVVGRLPVPLAMAPVVCAVTQGRRTAPGLRARHIACASRSPARGPAGVSASPLGCAATPGCSAYLSPDCVPFPLPQVPLEFLLSPEGVLLDPGLLALVARQGMGRGRSGRARNRVYSQDRGRWGRAGSGGRTGRGECNARQCTVPSMSGKWP